MDDLTPISNPTPSGVSLERRPAPQRAVAPTTFLNRLFRYKSTEKKTQLEDFLSEVLADFLNRAPAPEAARLIADCFVPREMTADFKALASGRRIEIRTQVRLEDRNILDLLVELDGQPLIVVESKIFAAFQRHLRRTTPETSNEQDDRNLERHQLETYGFWLRDAKKPQGWPGVIAVLTHAAKAPADFVVANSERYGAIPHQVYWRNLHGMLRRVVGSNANDPDVPAWKFVGREICSFLESYEMDSSDLTAVDISAVNVALSPIRKFDAVFTEVGAELLHRHPGLLVARSQSHESAAAASRAWGWTYFDGAKKMYVAYGIYFAPLLGDLAQSEPRLPEPEHAFVAVGSDENPLEFSDGESIGWHRVGEGYWYLKPFPLSARHFDERFPQFLVRLVEGEFAAIEKIRDAQLAAGAGESATAT
ncbi:PDDEXK-like family protein [Methylobacterium planeticum]|nr:PD-(D/E)XK nuclease family protein [Methylobacterium planeticum]